MKKPKKPILILSIIFCIVLQTHSINNIKPIKYLDDFAQSEILTENLYKNAQKNNIKNKSNYMDEFPELLETENHMETDKQLEDIKEFEKEQFEQENTQNKKELEIEEMQFTEEQGLGLLESFMKIHEKIDYMTKIYSKYYHDFCNQLKSSSQVLYIFPILFTFFVLLLYISIQNFAKSRNLEHNSCDRFSKQKRFEQDLEKILHGSHQNSLNENYSIFLKTNLLNTSDSDFMMHPVSDQESDCQKQQRAPFSARNSERNNSNSTSNNLSIKNTIIDGNDPSYFMESSIEHIQHNSQLYQEDENCSFFYKSEGENGSNNRRN